MNDFKQITPETGSAAGSFAPKSPLTRLKAALKAHISIDSDWSAAVKIKKQNDPVVRALMQHDPRRKNCAKGASFSQHPTPIY